MNEANGHVRLYPVQNRVGGLFHRKSDRSCMELMFLPTSMHEILVACLMELI